MAASPEIKNRIDGFLDDVFIMATEELPDNADDWSQMEDWQQDSWSMEWDQAMVGDLRELEQCSIAGEMNWEQSERYARLLAVLRESLPVLDRLGLQKPGIDLDAALARLQQAASEKD